MWYITTLYNSCNSGGADDDDEHDHDEHDQN